MIYADIEGDLVCIDKNDFYLDWEDVYGPTPPKKHLYFMSDQDQEIIKSGTDYTYVILNTAVENLTHFESINTTLDFECIYVGKGVNRRCINHFSKKTLKNNTFKSKKVCSILSQYSYPEVRIVYTGTHEDSLKKEVELIAEIGRRNLNKGSLVNLTDGGGGAKNLIQSEEAKKRLSESKKGKNKGVDAYNSIPVYQYTLDGMFVNSFINLSEAVKFIGKDGYGTSHISNCLKGKARQSWNFQWFSEYKGEVIPPVKRFSQVLQKGVKRPCISKRVCQISNETNVIIKTFDSVGEAYLDTGLKYPYILNSIRGKNKKDVDYYFKFEKDLTL